MLKLFARTVLVFALCLGTVATCIYAVTFSPSYNKCEGEYAQQGGKNEQAQFSERIGALAACEATFANENGGAITGIATVLLTVVTALLVWMAYDQGRTARAQLRAYVFIDNVKGQLNQRAGNWHFAVKVRIKNFGATPAHQLQS